MTRMETYVSLVAAFCYAWGIISFAQLATTTF